MPTAWEREQDRERKAQYLAEREAETRRRNELIDKQVTGLNSILSAGTSRSAPLSHEARKRPVPAFNPAGLDQPTPEPVLSDFVPIEPGALGRMIPGWSNATMNEQPGLQ